MTEGLVSLVDLSLERSQAYRKTYDEALKGQLGEVVRLGGRLFIRREARDTERPADLANRSSGIGS